MNTSPTAAPSPAVVDDASRQLSIYIGYRFVPSDRELIVDYLMKKINNQLLSDNIIIEDNVYMSNPWDLAVKYKPQEGQKWYFFTTRDEKYAKENPPNRPAGDGFWKAIGAQKKFYNNKKEVGVKNCLIFFKGKPSKGDMTNWLMYEYLLHNSPSSSTSSDNMRLNNCVLCKIYKKVSKSNHDHSDNDVNTRADCVSLDISQVRNIISDNRLILENQNQPVTDTVDPPAEFEYDDATN
ncbi:hypothetical protein ACOSQ4_020708 [Xanthoceras sorbifolium]